MRFSVAFTLVIPLLSALTATLGRPIYSGEELSTRNADLDERDVVDYIDDYDLRALDSYADLDARDVIDSIADYLEVRAAKRPKVSAAQQKARKDSVRNTVKTNQANNAAKKANLQQQAANGHRHAPVRSSTKKDQAKKALKAKNEGKPTPPGYRAKGRAEGRRLPKQPKTPKPNMVKGQAKSEKAQRTQAAANARTQQRKQAGRNNNAAAKQAYKKTTSLPNRKNTFTAPGGQKVTGKDVRTAVFNQHKNGGKPFKNALQGPADKKSRPLPKMKGSGSEYPVVSKKGGYQGGADVGTMRVVTQPKQKGGTSFKGVIAHDSTRAPGTPGYNDHFQVKSRKK